MSRKNRQAAAALETSEARYRTLIESIDEGFCVIEVLFDGAGHATDYRFLEVNPSFEHQTGLRDAVGKRMRELAANHEEHWFRIYGEIATTGQPRRFERRAEALSRWYDVYAFRVGEPQQHRVAILFNDVSERKQAEQVLRDEHRRKDEFLAILAHELRNPLAPLRNGLEILRLARNDPDAVERTRVMMERQVRQMVSLVDELLDVSRIGRGLVSFEPKRVDVADVVRGALETAEPLLRERGHELSVELPPDSIHVFADAARLIQAVSNLLGNAAKYTDPGGRISLSAKRVDAQAAICVSDNGIGIAPQMLASVFDLFTQVESATRRSQGGLGIGLTIVKRLVELHGGTVEAHSEGVGRGSRFTILLPLAATSET